MKLEVFGEFEFGFGFRPMKGLPRCPLHMEVVGDGGEFGEWDNWARNQILSAGSDLLGKFSNLQVIITCILLRFSFFVFMQKAWLVCYLIPAMF